MDPFGDDFQDQRIQITLSAGELVDLIEIGSIAEHESGWKWPILEDLRRFFTDMAQDVNAAADEV